MKKRQGDRATWRCGDVAAISRSLPLLFLLLIPLIADAQTGEITGRVVTEDGTGARYVTVYLRAVAADRRPTSGLWEDRTTTDENGDFKFTGLAPRVYTVAASAAKGYVQRPVPPAERQGDGFHRAGAFVMITMIKGGVITGRVTNAMGEPVIGVRVNALMTRDAEGNPVRGGGGPSRFTDDRGVYRLYGLQPGTYVIHTRNGISSPSPYDQDAPTYHPSSTRETATEVTVTSGAEVSGVDIRYRDDRGHVISGVVTGDPEPSQINYGINVWLTNSTGNVYPISTTAVRRDDGTSGFSIHGVADGEYEIVARRGVSNEEFLASAPRRIVVKGADVEGIELKLLPLGSITGRFALEAAPNACESRRKWFLGEALLALHGEAKQDGSVSARSRSVFSGLNEKGEFTIYDLEANRYFLEPRLPNENWYVKSITGSTSTPANARDSAARNSAQADVAQSGIALKSGEKISGVTVTISDGGAGMSGKVIPAKEGSLLPARLRVYLVPSEAAAANDVLRYASAFARSDGSFSMRNLSPGKYWLIARAARDEPSGRPPAPAVWDSIERAKLRKDAEGMKVEIVLKPCQRVTDQIVKQY